MPTPCLRQLWGGVGVVWRGMEGGVGGGVYGGVAMMGMW